MCYEMFPASVAEDGLGPPCCQGGAERESGPVPLCGVGQGTHVCCVPAEAVLQLQEFHLPHNFCCLSVIWMRRIWAAGWGSVMI